MPKCSGCSSSIVVHHTNNNCLNFSGDGSLATPLTAALTFDPSTANCINCAAGGLKLIIDNVTPSNALSCGPNGLFATAGGGGGARMPYYTVDTLGAFGFATPAPFLGTADFHGNGVNDQVAIQAAIDAAVGAGGPAVSVFLMPGFYNIQGPINTKGILLWSDFKNGLYGAYLYQANPGVRVIDNTFGGVLGAVLLQGITIYAPAGGSALIYTDGFTDMGIHMRKCAIRHQGGIGADQGAVQAGQNLVFNAENPWVDIQDCDLSTDATAIFTEGQAFIRDNIVVGMIDVYQGGGAKILNNFCSGPGAAAIRVSGFTEGPLKISGNQIYNTAGHGILLHGLDPLAIGGHILGAMITDNQIFNVGALGASFVKDGILIEDNVDRSFIQGNKIAPGGVPFGRYNINIRTADCNDNYVSNNDLHTNFPTGALNDAGTGTHVAAGNWL